MISPKKTAKPCPFCDGPAIGNDYDEVWCDRDGCPDDVLPLDIWNQRPAEDRLRAALGEIYSVAWDRPTDQGSAWGWKGLGELFKRHGIDPETLTET